MMGVFLMIDGRCSVEEEKELRLRKRLRNSSIFKTDDGDFLGKTQQK